MITVQTEPTLPRRPGDPALSQRQQRERAYYEQFSRRLEPNEITFDPVRGDKRSPWNSYWFVYGFVRGFSRPMPHR